MLLTYTHVNEIRARLENASQGIFRVPRGNIHTTSPPQTIFLGSYRAKEDSVCSFLRGGHALAAIATLSLMRSPFQKMPWHAIRSVISFSAAHSHTSFNIKCVISANGLIASQARHAPSPLYVCSENGVSDSYIARLYLF